MTHPSDPSIGTETAKTEQSVPPSTDLPIELPPFPEVSTDPAIGGARPNPWASRSAETAALADRISQTAIEQCVIRVRETGIDSSLDRELEQEVNLYELLIGRLHAEGIEVELSLVVSDDAEYVGFVSRMAARFGVLVNRWFVPPSPVSEELLQLLAAHSPGAVRGVDLSEE